jgi:5-methylcytosine-specific restriction endonuclease McrA
MERSEAISKGLNRYFTGRHCKNGHISERWTARSDCRECHILRLRQWYRSHMAHKKLYVREYAKRNLEKRALRQRLRKARKKDIGGSHTIDQIKEMLFKQKWKCAACQKSIKNERHIDHIVPISSGGSNDISNLQGLCPRCNQLKYTKDPIKWAQENGRLL